MCCRAARSCLESDVGFYAFEDCIEIEGITMNQARSLDSVFEKEVNLLKILQRACLKVEDQSVWIR